MPFEKGNISWNKGKKCKQISISCKGRRAWNKGIPMKEESRLKMIAKLKGKHSSPMTEFKKGNCGEKSGHWIRGWYIGNGYKYIYNPNHPYCTKQGYIREHKLIVEKHIGRYIKKEEQIHHINKNKLDNRIENLMLFPDVKSHRSYHAVEQLTKRIEKLKSKSIPIPLNS